MSYQLKLFKETDFIISQPKVERRFYSQQEKTAHLCNYVTLTSRYQQPMIMPYIGNPPEYIRAVVRTRPKERANICGHFYIDDTKMEKYWNNLPVYEELFLQFKMLIAPNLSCTEEMPLSLKQWNLFRNHLMTAWMQHRGISVIPDIIWWNGADLEWCLDGLPRQSGIAINSTGLRNNERSKKIWLKYYYNVVDMLQPIWIMRYGAKQDGEYSDISIYYSNDNRLIAQERRNRYGW